MGPLKFVLTRARVVAFSALVIGGCGGGGSSAPPPPPPASYTISGVLSGLASGASLVLQNNRGDDLRVTTDGSFVFATAQALGSTYAVSILTPPRGQRCTLTGGSGTTVGQNVDGVVVSCAVDNWVTNGSVRASALSADAGTLYMAGDFNYVGPRTGGFVPIESATGAVTGNFPIVDGVVSASVADGSGGWFIGGTFERVGSTARMNLAHIRADGSLDSAWNPGVDGAVWTLARTGSTLYIGGAFNTVGGLPRYYAAALDVSSGAVTGWAPNPNSTVSTLVASGATLYVSGSFSVIAGQQRNHLAAFDTASGLLGAWNPNVDGGSFIATVNAIVPAGSTVFIGGQFVSVGGQQRSSLAALDATTGAALGWNPSVSAGGVVATLALAGSTVYVGGQFSSIAGVARLGAASLDAASGAVKAWQPDFGDGGPDPRPYVAKLLVSNDTVYVAGLFATIGGQARQYLGAVHATDGSPTAWNPRPSDSVFALALEGATIYAAGAFNSVGGVTRKSLAALDTATGKATAWDPQASSDSQQTPMYALVLSGTTVYVCGSFTRVGGVARSNIAALSATTAVATPWNPGVEGTAAALVVSDSTVFVGGYFSTVGGATRNNIAALDVGTGLATAWNPNPNAAVTALAVAGDTVYAGGGFTTIGGQTRNAVAALSASTGAATAWNPNATLTSGRGDVATLLVSGSTVYVGGTFDAIGGQRRVALAALSVDTGLASAWNADVGITGRVNAIALVGTTAYIGGGFASLGRQLRSNLAAVDLGSGLALPWYPKLDTYGGVYTLAVAGDKLLAGGRFTVVDGEAQKGVAFIAR